MTDDHAALIKIVSVEHHDGIDHNLSSWWPWCYRCKTGYPCTPARLVEALEQQAEQASVAERASNAWEANALVYAQAAETAERRLADNNRGWAAKLVEVGRSLAAARAALDEYGEHKSGCPYWLSQEVCACGFAPALAAPASAEEGE